MLIEYSSNNSGGSWWLDKKDWIALEKAGWTVQWGSLYFCKSKYRLTGEKTPNYKFKECASSEVCKGHRLFKSYKDMTNNDTWLGCYAQYAKKDFNSPKEALEEFERVTGKSVMEEGCNCCGAPHSFSWNGGYCSGEDCGEYLFGEIAKKSKRELLEEKYQ